MLVQEKDNKCHAYQLLNSYAWSIWKILQKFETVNIFASCRKIRSICLKVLWVHGCQMHWTTENTILFWFLVVRAHMSRLVVKTNPFIKAIHKLMSSVTFCWDKSKENRDSWVFNMIKPVAVQPCIHKCSLPPGFHNTELRVGLVFWFSCNTAMLEDRFSKINIIKAILGSCAYPKHSAGRGTDVNKWLRCTLYNSSGYFLLHLRGRSNKQYSLHNSENIQFQPPLSQTNRISWMLSILIRLVYFIWLYIVQVLIMAWGHSCNANRLMV